jgi:curli biogenesis system outer membrane secretion channel CsgG
MATNRCVTLTLALALAATLAHAQKKRVAVMNFDYGTVQGGLQAIFGANQDIGKGIADLLVDKFVADGTYSVIERKALDTVLAEQNFSNSNRADPATAAKIAKVLGVDAIIIGTITQFGRDDTQTNVGGAAVGRVTGRFGLGGVSKKESKAVVAITARMVDTSTAEILASVTGRSESTRSGAGLIGAGGTGAAAAGGVLDMRSTNFANTILGEAVNGAVKSVAQQLEAKAGALPTRTVTIDGLVADVSADGTIIVNVGSAAGVKVGDVLHIKRVSRKITDPATGKVLRQIEEAVGDLKVTEVDAQSAVGKFSGAAPAKVGDSVRNQ